MVLSQNILPIMERCLIFSGLMMDVHLCAQAERSIRCSVRHACVSVLLQNRPPHQTQQRAVLLMHHLDTHRAQPDARECSALTANTAHLPTLTNTRTENSYR